MDRSELLDQVLDEIGSKGFSEPPPAERHPTRLSVVRLAPTLSQDQDRLQQSRISGGVNRCLRAVCLIIMAFCTYGLFAFFPTVQKRPTTSPPLTHTSASVNPSASPSDGLSPATPAETAKKRYITKSIKYTGYP